MQKPTLAILAMAFACMLGEAQAEEESRQLGPHEHGHGTLNIAIEGNTLDLEFEAPGMDVVGFEHQASTPEQKELVEKALKDLGDGIMGLVVLPAAAACKLASKDVAVVAEEQHDVKEGQAEDASAPEAEPEDHHNAFHGTYQLTCAAPDLITSIDFPFFERFPNSQELDVTVIDERGQTAYEVKREAPKLELAR